LENLPFLGQNAERFSDNFDVRIGEYQIFVKDESDRVHGLLRPSVVEELWQIREDMGSLAAGSERLEDICVPIRPGVCR